MTEKRKNIANVAQLNALMDEAGLAERDGWIDTVVFRLLSGCLVYPS